MESENDGGSHIETRVGLYSLPDLGDNISHGVKNLVLKVATTGIEGSAMKFFIINSFRSLVYIAYFAVIIVFALGTYVERREVNRVFYDLFGRRLTETGEGIVSLSTGLLVGWFAATLLCGLIVTMLDIRDDINDRLPDARDH